MNRFSGLDLVNRVLEELWTEVCNTVHEAANNTIPMKKMQEGRQLPEEALQIAEERSILKRQHLKSILKSRDITLPKKVHLVKAVVFPVVTYGCESWTIKKAEC